MPVLTPGPTTSGRVPKSRRQSSSIALVHRRHDARDDDAGDRRARRGPTAGEEPEQEHAVLVGGAVGVGARPASGAPAARPRRRRSRVWVLPTSIASSTWLMRRRPPSARDPGQPFTDRDVARDDALLAGTSVEHERAVVVDAAHGTRRCAVRPPSTRDVPAGETRVATSHSARDARRSRPRANAIIDAPRARRASRAAKRGAVDAPAGRRAATRGRRGAQLGRKRARRRVQVDADARDHEAHAVDLGVHLGEDAGDLAAVEQDVVRPLDRAAGARSRRDRAPRPRRPPTSASCGTAVGASAAAARCEQ